MESSNKNIILAKDTFSNCNVVLKELIRNPITNEINNKELEILTRCNSDYIIKIYGLYEHNNILYNIIEYNTSIDLYDYFVNDYNIDNINENKINNVFYQMALGLQYLKDNTIIHHDIKPENIIIDVHENIKIIDFDLACFYDETKPIITSGTIDYIAPELLSKEKNHYCNDIWSFGVTLYVISYNKYPNYYNKITKKYIPNTTIDNEILNKFSIEHVNFINSILIKDYRQRPSIETILTNEWFYK